MNRPAAPTKTSKKPGSKTGRKKRATKKVAAKRAKSSTVKPKAEEARGSGRFEDLATARERLEALYERSRERADFRGALAAQRELNKLLDLYDAQQFAEAAAAEANSAEQGQLDAIAKHLRPLGLAPEGYPLEEIARIAADRIRRPRKAAGWGA